MATVTRRIGLSLGADICWPICYEEILKRLNLSIDWKGDRVGVTCDRVTIEPFDLRRLAQSLAIATGRAVEENII